MYFFVLNYNMIWIYIFLSVWAKIPRDPEIILCYSIYFKIIQFCLGVIADSCTNLFVICKGSLNPEQNRCYTRSSILSLMLYETFGSPYSLRC